MARPERPQLRALHPMTSSPVSGGSAPLPTLYFANRLLVSGYPDSERSLSIDELQVALNALDLEYVLTDRTRRRVQRLRSLEGTQRELLDEIWVSSVEIKPTERGKPAPDAWEVLQQLRTGSARLRETVSLEHVIRPAGYWGGIGGYWGGIGGYWGGIGGEGGMAALAEYQMPGRGGRMPVAVGFPDPALRARDLPRNPVIAVLDSEVAEHPWFPVVSRRGKAGVNPSADRIMRLDVKDGALVRAGRPKAADPQSLTGAREHLEGHGTFIAGLLRQGCPEATILSIPVMDGDGVAEEGEVLAALMALLDDHISAQAGGEGQVVDVLSLSLGYYPEDGSYTTGPIADVLRRFADHGVLVVAGVGNDASTNAFVPAALAADVPRPVRAGTTPPPLTSVGAQNPDGTTVALFSNALDHVSVYRPGVALVSTVPPIDGAGQSSVSVRAATTPGPRTTMDPDNYSSGFALWSGTSFATPVFAAELAAELVRAGDLSDVSEDAMRSRAVKALQTCLKGARR